MLSGAAALNIILIPSGVESEWLNLAIPLLEASASTWNLKGLGLEVPIPIQSFPASTNSAWVTLLDSTRSLCR